jgi:ferredoxin
VHIRADSCARARLTTSRCDACVRSCPTGAWSLDDEDLCFDPERCDACGLCVVVCPLEAIETDPPALLIGSDTPRTLWLACDKAGVPAGAGQGTVPCLHGLPVPWLVQQARKHHVARIACASGDCSQCARQPPSGQRLPHRWKEWERCHPHSGPLPPLVATAPADWQRRTQGLHAPDTSRRRFLWGRLAPAAAALHNSDRVGSGRLAEVAPTDGGLPWARWQLHLNLQQCTWCMVCVHLCPTQALGTTAADDTEERTLALHVNTRACSGCGLCVDGCDLSALSLQALATPSQGGTRTYPLQRVICSRCRVDFWRLNPVERQCTPGSTDSHASGAEGEAPVCPTCVRGKTRWTQRVVQHQD